MIDLVSEIRSVRSEMGVPPAAQLPLTLVGAGAKVVAYVETLGRDDPSGSRGSTEIDFAAGAAARRRRR